MTPDSPAVPVPVLPLPALHTPVPPAPEPKERDPSKVYVASVMEDTMTRETGMFWEELAKQPIPGIEIVRTRVSGYGLAKCRNLATWMALQSDCGRFVFIDSDMKPSIPMLARLLSHSEAAVSGYYPKKRADRLEWVGNLIAGAKTRQDGLRECMDFGGGFCCIHLTLIDEMVRHFHEQTWFISEDEPFKNRVMWDLWSNGPVVDNWHGRSFPRYLTEDFYFCWRIRQMGVPVFMDTLCQVGHVGPVDFLELHHRLRELENQSIYRAPVG